MKLITQRLVLRGLEMKDAEMVAEHANNLNVSKHLLELPHPYRLKDAKDFIKGDLKKRRRKDRTGHTFAITLRDEKKAIGVISLNHANKVHGTATMGYWLGEPYWRQGIMTEAATAMINFAFKKLKLRRINICAFTGNAASNGLIKKLGFTYEGTMRKNVRSKATKSIHDEHFYGLLKEEWMKRKKP